VPASLVVHVVVDGIKIICGSAKPIFSDEEFIEHLLMQLSHRLLGGTYCSRMHAPASSRPDAHTPLGRDNADLHQAAVQEGRQVEKRDLSLLFQSLVDKATSMYVAALSPSLLLNMR
jgi:hypothetical protein